MISDKTPLVSIGMPVYNGEIFIRDAIESILSQTYANLELIISDNASTDDTPDICQHFAGSDRRIKYFQNEYNQGAGPNYDNCFYKSSGKYFKWAAHDDMLDKHYLELTVASMERDGKAVLCFTDTMRIDQHGNDIEYHELKYPGIFSSSQSRRFHTMLNYLRENECFFGLFKRDVLEGSELHGNYMNSDLVLMAEVALRGEFIKVPQPLFLHRHHDDRYTRSVYPDRNASATWFDTSNKNRKTYRAIRLYFKYIEVIQKNINSRMERWRCYRYLLRYAFIRRNLKILLIDVVYMVSPWIYNNVGPIRSADINTK